PKGDGKPMLQGWAVVENASEEDWRDVRLALGRGRPISFQMDLYQPLYVPPPTGEPGLFASLRPPPYQGAMERPAVAAGGGAMPPKAAEPLKLPTEAKGEAKEDTKPEDAAYGRLRDKKSAEALAERLRGDMDLGKGISAVAAGG